MEDELSKLDESQSSLKEVPAVPFKDKIEELESVLQSISSMRSRLEEGVAVLEQALLQIGCPPLQTIASGAAVVVGTPEQRLPRS